MTTAPDDQPEKIGVYRLGKVIGKGGMGAVYAATHELLGRRAAVKLLHDRFARRDEIVERFFNEARVASAIADPGIVQIFDFGLEDGNVYIVMELLDGESLDARLRRLGRLPYRDALRLARQLALSLEAAHQRGVVHRDLKPENVMVVPDPEASSGERTKILDFGIAKLVDPDESRVHTRTGQTMGTPHYMSPEQCRGTGKVDHRTDIYALGCVMFQLVVGETVFSGEGAGELYVAHMMDEPRSPSSRGAIVPRAVDALVLRCLAKEPADRFSSMRELVGELDAALGRSSDALTPLPKPIDYASFVSAPTGMPEAAPAAETMSRAKPPRWLLPIAAIGVIIVGAGAFYAVHDRSEPPAKPPAEPVTPAAIARPVLAPIDAAVPPTIDAAPPAEVVEDAKPASPATPPRRRPPAVVKTVPHTEPSTPAPQPTAVPKPPVDPYADR